MPPLGVPTVNGSNLDSNHGLDWVTQWTVAQTNWATNQTSCVMCDSLFLYFIFYLQDKIKALENSKEYLERSVKESENNLRELISHKKSAS